VRLEGKAGIALCKKATDRINTSKYAVYREKRHGMDARLKRKLLDARVLTAIKNEDFCGYQIIKDIKSRIPELTPVPCMSSLRRSSFTQRPIPIAKSTADKR